LNVWLAAVGRDPEFDSGVETDRHPETTELGETSAGGCDWPEFEVNFGCGDALVGLPDERVQDVLHAQYGTEMRAIAHARIAALEDTRERESLRRAVDVRGQIRPELDAMFEASVEDSQASAALLDETTPFYWPLQFWHVYQDSGGFDCVVGNPPWVTHGGEHVTRFLAERYEYQSGRPDLYRYFLERSFTATNGCMGLVTPNTWLSIPGARDLRRVLLRSARLTTIAFVPDSAFTDVGQNSIAVVVDKQGPPTVVESSDDDFGRGGITVGELTTDGEFQPVRTVPPASIEPPAYHVNPYVGAKEYAITAKMTANATTLADIADLTVGYQLYHRSIHTPAEIENEVFHSEESDHDAHVPDTRAASLRRFHLDSSPTQYVDTSAEFFRIPPKRFLDGEKVLLREVPSKRETGLIAARSTTTRLFPKSVISVVLTDDDYDYQHLLGVLNSRVAYLQSLVTGEKMGQHLFPRVSLTQLRGLAIEGTTELTPLVERLEALSARRFHFRQAWKRRVEAQTTADRTLAAILGADHSAGDTEEATEAWVVDCSVEPDGDGDVLEREYSAFEFVGDTDRPSGVLYGIDDGVETAVLSVEFRTREQLQLVSLSVAALLDSRVNVDHLRHVLEKAVVRGAGEASVEPAVTLVRDVQRDVSDAVGSDVDLDERPTDIVRIEAALSDAQMELDAAVFDLYGLTPADARTVLDVLDVREMVTEETISRLTRLQTAARDG
ncbi:Eco57I restriction-modification methylase domain-containing protein, partial [Haloferax profundi]|uniref:Eco57I restriction-modification methylase domain-containing protein n=1 Tax=Haloferax profundi TaxID=1544718 RepID=UPI000A83D0C4